MQTRVYGTTFYPSTLEDYKAISVSVSNYSPTIVEIELVPVRGMRIAGSVVSGSERPVGGLNVSPSPLPFDANDDARELMLQRLLWPR